LGRLWQRRRPFFFVYAVTSAAIPRQHRFQSTTQPSCLLPHFDKHWENHMAKTNYQLTLNGKVVGIHKSDGIYTHAVVVHNEADAFYH
jgi:hypothetical protein